MVTPSGILHRVLCIVLCLSLPACAASRSTVIESGYKLDTIKLCRNYLKDRALIQKHAITDVMETHEIAVVAEKETDDERKYAHVLALQMRVRSLNEASCDQVIDDQNGKKSRQELQSGFLPLAPLLRRHTTPATPMRRALMTATRIHTPGISFMERTGLYSGAVETRETGSSLTTTTVEACGNRTARGRGNDPTYNVRFAPEADI